MLNKTIPVLTAIVLAAAMILIFVSWIGNINNKGEINTIARKYMLIMETEGYLSVEQEQNLIADLEAENMNNISLSGTTMTEVGYGNEIVLNISGNMKFNNFDFISLFELDKEIIDIPINKPLRSTAKY